MKDLFNLEGLSAVVTGANRGLGKEMAIALADAGANLVVTSRDLKNTNDTVKEIEKRNVKVLSFEMDVRNRKQIDAMVEAALKKFGKIDILVNNAGINKGNDAEKMLYQDWFETIDTNLNGVFQVSQAVGRAMIEKKKGSIINISSIASMVPLTLQNQAPYNVSKAGLNMLTKSLASEWVKYNIRVNSLAPGFTTGGMNTPQINKGDEIINKMLSHVPMQRFGEPYELFGMLIYLASEASSYTTGGIFFVDGGFGIW